MTRPEHDACAVVLAAALTAAQGLLVAATVRGLPFSWVLSGHVVVCMAAGAWILRRRRHSTRYDALLWVSTAAFGPIGPTGVLMAMALGRYHARRATPMNDWHAMLFPQDHMDEDSDLWRRIGQRASDRPADQQVTPFLEVLSFGTVPQRQAVIAIIAQQFHPAFAPALRAALRDEHNVVRVQAATAIARLENQFLERTIRLETTVRETTDDPDAILALASHYDDQAFAGLLDPTRELECRVKAHDGYERYLRLRHDDRSVEFRLARLQLRRGLASDAAPRFRALLQAGDASARLWLMESLFALERYGELRDVASEYTDAESTMTPEVAATIELWAGVEEVA